MCLRFHTFRIRTNPGLSISKSNTTPTRRKERRKDKRKCRNLLWNDCFLVLKRETASTWVLRMFLGAGDSGHQEWFLWMGIHRQEARLGKSLGRSARSVWPLCPGSPSTQPPSRSWVRACWSSYLGHHWWLLRFFPHKCTTPILPRPLFGTQPFLMLWLPGPSITFYLHYLSQRRKQKQSGETTAPGSKVVPELESYLHHRSWTFMNSLLWARHYVGNCRTWNTGQTRSPKPHDGCI